MAFTGNYICTSYKRELLKAMHNFSNPGGHVFKLALYDNNASFTAATTDYTTTNEISGTGYTAGGITLTNVEPTESGTVGLTDFPDVSLLAATVTARGAMIYNSTAGTNAVCILDFGLNRSVTAGIFPVAFPTPDRLNAILRIG